MAIPQTNITWTSLKDEFGGDYPAGKNVKEGYYYRGYLVPDIVPNAGVSNTGLNVNAGSLKGAIKQQYYFNANMFDYNLPDHDAGSYWYTIANGENGGIDGGYSECYSNSSTVITTPDIGYDLKLYVYGFSATIGAGYRSSPPDLYGNRAYYYDRANTPGIRLLSADNSTVIGSSDSANTTEYWYNTQANSCYVPGFSANVSPNTIYHLKYKVNWLNGGSGRDYWVSSGPFYYAVIK
jgi:hypothetical protein